MDTMREHEVVRQELARLLDCFTSTELRTLAGITEGTEQAWRKRGIVDYILFGNVYYYPRKPLTGRLGSLVRERRRVPAKAVL